jgi:hypothetical protein
VISLGQPSLDRAWDVRRIAVSPQDPTVDSAAIAFVFRGGAVGYPTLFVDRTRTPLPVVGPWDESQFTLRPGEPCFVQIVGGTPGAGIFASMQAVEIPTDQVPYRRRRWGLWRKGIMRAVS